jgi:hypothetical protein
MFGTFNVWFSHWEWSLLLIVSILISSMAICGLAIAVLAKGNGGGSSKPPKPTKPKGGIKVAFSKEFLSFLFTEKNQQQRFKWPF